MNFGGLVCDSAAPVWVCLSASASRSLGLLLDHSQLGVFNNLYGYGSQYGSFVQPWGSEVGGLIPHRGLRDVYVRRYIGRGVVVSRRHVSRKSPVSDPTGRYSVWIVEFCQEKNNQPPRTFCVGYGLDGNRNSGSCQPILSWTSSFQICVCCPLRVRRYEHQSSIT